MADNHFMYWIRQFYGHKTDMLQHVTARGALVQWLVQEEIDHRLQQGLMESHALSGWSSVSPCASLGGGARTTAPGLSFHERTVQRLQQREQREGRSAEAHTASELMEQLKPRDQAALLLTSYPLKPARSNDEGVDIEVLLAMNELPPRELALNDVWALQHVLARWLDIPLDRPFPTASALQRAGVRARNRLMSVMERSLLAAGILVA